MSTDPSLRVAAAGFAAAALLAGPSRAQVAPPAGEAPANGKPAGPEQDSPVSSLPPIVVTGTASSLAHDIPQAVATVNEDEIGEQAASSLQDALRNVPGITLNAGEGGAHGDSVNLRGLSVPDSFFLDGLRDIGAYVRDTFDEAAVEVPLGPSSVLFGRGSTAGVINQVSKEPTLTAVDETAIEAGTAGMERATADLDWVIDGHTAARLNLLGERTGIAGRDDALTKRTGIAPALEIGIGEPTSLTLTFLHQTEDDVPDYGIPFIDGSPAPVARSNFYGLVDYDRTRNNVNIATVRLDHRFTDHVSLTSSLRYGRYAFAYLLSAPHLDDDYTLPPPPGTPLSDIVVYRDQPSSAGSEEELLERTDLTSRFHAAGMAHTLITGIEVSRELSDVARYMNGIDVIPPTPLLDPDPYYSPPTPLAITAQPHTYGSDASAYATDRVRLAPGWDLNAGVRWDRFDSHYSEAISGSAFSRSDTEVSPRAAVVFNPVSSQSYYLSYGASYNPAIEYLTLAPTSASLSPEKDFTTEAGSRVDVLGGRLSVTASVFDTLLENARLADPDDPTVQQAPFDQRVLGAELGVAGSVATGVEVQAGYTHLDDRISASTDPSAMGKTAPNTPDDALSLWATWEPGRAWKLGGGPVYVSHRFADTHDTAGVPAYVVLNTMVSYRLNPHLEFQLNVNNVTDKLYFNSLYYSAVDENHAVPGPGRTVLLTVEARF